MPLAVDVQTVHLRTLAAVRCEVAPGAVGSAWGPAIRKALAQFATAGDVYATETPGGEAAVAVHRGPYDSRDSESSG